MKSLTFSRNRLKLIFDFSAKAPVCFFVTAAPEVSGSLGLRQLRSTEWFKRARLVELQATGFSQNDHHGNKYTGTAPADQLRYHSHSTYRSNEGRACLQIVQEGADIRVTTYFEFARTEPLFRTWAKVENLGAEPLELEYVGSLSLTGLSFGGQGAWDRKMVLHRVDNNWCGECQWRSGLTGAFGLHQFYGPERKAFGVQSITASVQGSWSTAGALPLGVIENSETGQSAFWEIEHSGSWQWQLSDLGGELCLRASGPAYRDSLWTQCLKRGESFISAPIRFGLCAGGLQEALEVLTVVRREQRRPHPDTIVLPVIFNDYMNCLNANPDEAKQLPLIERAARAGCEYFVIDAGWYAEQGRSWWDTVGEWEEAPSRYPRGLKYVMDAIRGSGMVPGLWLEIEVMGIHCSLAARLPDDWFFMKGNKRVIDNGRYQLDFRNPQVRAHADALIDRLVADYRIGYIKMDYNINAGPGTDCGNCSPGAGLLGHSRAYLQWVEGVFDRHPELVIENCGSGGLRMDSSMLRVHPLQSVTDQSDYRFNAFIAAAAASAVPPEQAAVWSYPVSADNEEETVFNMINALLLRMHLSGDIMGQSERSFQRICEGILLYKRIRSVLAASIPMWPLGMPHNAQGWLAYAAQTQGSVLLTLWRMDTDATNCVVPFATLAGQRVRAECIYPSGKKTDFSWDEKRGELMVCLGRRFTARLFALSFAEAEDGC